MSRGGALPMNRPTAWVYLPSGDCTIRWQRGDTVAYIFAGKQLQTYPDKPSTAEMLDTLPLSTSWTDLADVRRTGEKWVNARRQRCRTCGVYS